MKETITVDADIIIEYLKTGSGKLTDAYEKYTMIITPATYTEILASNTFKDSKLEEDVQSFLEEYFTVHEATKDIALKAAQLIRVKNELTLALAYVAATALETGSNLLSDRDDMYSGVEGLEMLDM